MKNEINKEKSITYFLIKAVALATAFGLFVMGITPIFERKSVNAP